MNALARPLSVPVWIGAWAALAIAWWTWRVEPAVRPQVDNDTQCYAEAARAIREGRSPYQEGERCYLYPPGLAFVLSLLPDLPPLHRARAAFGLNTLAALGLAVTLPLAAGLGRHPLGLLSAFWLFSPVTLGSIGTGNVAIWVAWLPLLALPCIRRFPVAGGLLLGAATMLKTMPGLYLVFLAASALRRRDALLARAAAAGLLVAAGSLLLPHSEEFLRVSAGQVDLHAREVRNFSLVSLAWWTLGGTPPSPWPAMGAGFLAAMLLGWQHRDGSRDGFLPEWALLGTLVHACAPIAWTMSFPQVFLAGMLMVRRGIERSYVTGSGPAATATHWGLAGLVAGVPAFPALFWTPDFPFLALVPSAVPFAAGLLALRRREGPTATP